MSTSTALGLNEQSEFSDRTRSLKQYSNLVMLPLFMMPVSQLNWLKSLCSNSCFYESVISWLLTWPELTAHDTVADSIVYSFYFLFTF